MFGFQSNIFRMYTFICHLIFSIIKDLKAFIILIFCFYYCYYYSILLLSLTWEWVGLNVVQQPATRGPQILLFTHK